MPHPSYKDHPLWKEAMALVTEAYALAEKARETAPLVSRHLRRAAVAVPANIAESLDGEEGEKRHDSHLRARGALAEIERQTRLLPDGLASPGEELAEHARGLFWRMGRA
ncbi:MAG: four helix bundle protein [Thermoanaerobaculia bacterium]